MFKVDDNKIIGSSNGKANETVVNLSNQLKNNKSRNLMYMPNIRAIRKLNFLIPNAKKAFNHL